MKQTKNTNLTWILLCLFGLVSFASPQVFADKVNVGLIGNTAVKGYDVVAYFTLAQPKKGSKQFVHRYQNVNYHFSNAEHLALFVQEPSKYVPQYGGYCAWAVSQGHTAPVDPNAWSIVDGKLYLNYSKAVRKKWLGNTPKFIKQANYHWQTLSK